MLSIPLYAIMCCIQYHSSAYRATVFFCACRALHNLVPGYAYTIIVESVMFPKIVSFRLFSRASFFQDCNACCQARYPTVKHENRWVSLYLVMCLTVSCFIDIEICALITTKHKQTQWFQKHMVPLILMFSDMLCVGHSRIRNAPVGHNRIRYVPACALRMQCTLTLKGLHRNCLLKILM